MNGKLGKHRQVGPLAVGLDDHLADLVEVAVHLTEDAVELGERYAHVEGACLRVAVRYRRCERALSRSGTSNEAGHR